MDTKPRTIFTILLILPSLLCFLGIATIVLVPENLFAALFLLGWYNSQTTAAPLPSPQNVVKIMGCLFITVSLFSASMFTKGKANWIVSIALVISFIALCIVIFATARLK